MTLRFKVQSFINFMFFIFALLILPSATQGQIPLDGNTGRPSPVRASAPLTPEMLGMPRTQIAFGDRALRLFNGRGAVSVRDKSLTGLQTLLFPPIEIRDYRFFLQFRETNANVLIQ